MDKAAMRRCILGFNHSCRNLKSITGDTELVKQGICSFQVVKKQRQRPQVWSTTLMGMEPGQNDKPKRPRTQIIGFLGPIYH